MRFDKMNIYGLITTNKHPNLRSVTFPLKEWSKLERFVVKAQRASGGTSR